MKKKSSTSARNINLGFVICFVFILFCGFITIIIPPKEKSTLENRNLNKIEVFNIRTFSTGVFQQNLENALADQVMFSRNIKYYSNKYLNYVDYKKINKKICKNKYVRVKNNYYTFDCDDAMIEGTLDLSDKLEIIKSRIDYLNKINSDKVYYYVIDRSYAYDFEKGKLVIDGYNIIKNNINKIDSNHVKRLNIRDYDDYRKYFYKSDHHWNYKGSYKGYSDIIKMLEGNVELLKPVSIMEIKNKFNGSISKNTAVYNIYDKFKYYKFDFDNYDVYINGTKSYYGGYDKFINDNTKYLNYYGAVYGGDYGEVVFDFKRPNKDNLMIIATSYSNPINVMLASHYNKTYVYDLRYYNNFDYNTIVKNNKIGKVLILLATDMLVNREVKLGGDV